MEIVDGEETTVDSIATRSVTANSFQEATSLVEHLVQAAWVTLVRRSYNFFSVETPRINNLETKGKVQNDSL